MKKTLLSLSVAGLILGLGASYTAGGFARTLLYPNGAEELAATLQLSPAQQAQWREIQEAKQANLHLLSAGVSQVRAVLDAELASTEPNLDLVAAESEQTVNALIDAARANRDRRLALYRDMSPEQKRKVATALQSTLQHLDRMRAHLLTLLGADLT